jgi:predicted PolB exonuclease-like 3'-5' exonuclease
MTVYIFDIETTGLELYLDRVIAIGLLNVESNKKVIFIGEDEKEILSNFLEKLQENDTLIGYNIKNFDLPFIFSRAVVNKLHINKLKRIKIIDLSEILHFEPYRTFGTTPKNLKFFRLDDFARIFGIQNGKYELNGMLMKEFFYRKEWNKIIEHLEDDLEKTFRIYQIINLVIYNGK